MSSRFLLNARKLADRKIRRKQQDAWTQNRPARKPTASGPSYYAPREFEFRGAVLELRKYRGTKPVMIDGPAGTGKTVGTLAWIYEMMDSYPGTRVLIARKTKESIRESVLVTWENHVLPEGSPMLDGPARENRESYRHANGSELAIIGLHDKKAVNQVKSQEYDIIYCNEASQLTEGDIGLLTTRLRNFRLPHGQFLIMDTNPDSPHHWLWQGHLKGEYIRFQSTHRDNPAYYDAEGNLTPMGDQYINGSLSNIRGLERERMVEGKWVAAEGAIYEFDERIHVARLEEMYRGIDRLPMNWPRIWVTDFGTTHPHVWQQWAIDDDGRAHRELEIYHTNLLLRSNDPDVPTVASLMRRATAGYPRPVAWICDHDRQERMQLEEEFGMRTIPAYKAVLPGIDATKQLLTPAIDGIPRLRYMAGALVHAPDPDLLERREPTSTEQEFAYYIWESGSKDAPRKQYDHGMDCTRYLASYLLNLSKEPKKQVQRARSVWPAHTGKKFNPS